MKRKINLIGFSLFFLLSIMIEMYCLLELRDDLITIVGMGIVVIISAFLLLDVIINETDKKNNNSKSENYDTSNLEKKLDELENIQKAIYVSTKKSYNLLDMKFSTLENDIEIHISRILEEQKILNDTIIKYSSKRNDILEDMQVSLAKIGDTDNIKSKNDHIDNQQNSENFDEKLSALDIDVTDPNKSLSPDEIAMLFEKLG